MSEEGHGDGPGDALPGAPLGEPTRDELLDNTPEALAMRRARAARAARAQRPAASPEGGARTSRRRLVVGGLLAALAAIRVLERAVRAGTGAGRRP